MGGNVVALIVLVIIILGAFMIGCEVGFRYAKQRYRIGPMHDAIARADHERPSLLTNRETLEKFEGKMRLGGMGVAREPGVAKPVQEPKEVLEQFAERHPEYEVGTSVQEKEISQAEADRLGNIAFEDALQERFDREFPETAAPLVTDPNDR